MTISKIVEKSTGITDDSRKVKKGFAFFAIKGVQFDGHKFIDTAIQNGAEIVVGELDEPSYFPDNIKYVKVNNSRVALANASKVFFNYPSKRLKMIGVTGTNGKTTISNLIYSIIKYSGRKAALIGTNGIYIDNKKIPAKLTTPGIIELNEILTKILEEKCEYCVMEVSSHALHQNRVYGIDYDIAIFSNLSQDHLDYHKTMQNYARAKKILFDGLSEDAIAISNFDDDYGQFMLEDCKAEKVRISTEKNADFRFLTEKNYLILEEEKFQNNLVGKFNKYNLAQAITAAKKLGIENQKIKSSCEKLTAPEGRMQKIELSNGATAIIDYAHTPDALEKALISLKEEQIGGELFCVFGCGGDRDRSKRPIMGAVALSNSDIAIVTSDNPRTEDPTEIIKDIIQEHPTKFKIEIDRKKAISKACKMSRKGDLILIAGKGHEKYQIIGTKKVHFDDVEIVENFK